MNTEKVGFRMEAKNPGDVQYSSVLTSAWFETVVRDGETPEQAFLRAKSVVEAQVDQRAAPAPPTESRKLQAVVEPELFDVRIPRHSRLSDRWFEENGVTSQKARSYQLSQIVGRTLREAERWIEDNARDTSWKGSRPSPRRPTRNPFGPPDRYNS